MSGSQLVRRSSRIMDIFGLINNISTTLLVISPTIFVLGVTLLGNAIEKSRQEEKAARESESSTIKKEIVDVEKSLNKAKKDGDTTDVYNSLEALRKRQKNTNDKIKGIKIKYNSINLLNTVIYPCIALLLALIFNQYSFSLFKQIEDISMYKILSLSIILILYSLYKIYKSLKLIEEISSNKKESEYYDQIIRCIKDALTQYEQTKKENASIEFTNKSFPLNITCSAEMEIEFMVTLAKGSVLNNTEVWFFIPDGFDLIQPPESKSWRQSPDFVPPGIRTVKIELGKVNIGRSSPGKLKIKTPSVAGKYSLRYSLQGDGYDGPTQELKLIVG